MVKARKWVLVKHFVGSPKEDDCRIEEEELPPLKDGEFLAEAVYLSVDPYMRPYSRTLSPGDTIMGEQVAKIIESKNPNYSVGEYITGIFGWRSHTIHNGEFALVIGGTKTLRKIDPTLSQPKSTAIGVLGMPGATAYFGCLRILSPKEGETLVVSGAAGAVGSIVGQIGKIKGCRVVGFAGSNKKVDYLKELGFDAAYNYKTISSLKETLTEACPNGIDMYFDNVGGDFFDTILPMMNVFGRVSVCGQISSYNNTEAKNGIQAGQPILGKQLKVEGFMVGRWIEEWPVAFKELDRWIQEGKLKYTETMTEGFDKMYDAFRGLFTGENIGKAVVKA